MVVLSYRTIQINDNKCKFIQRLWRVLQDVFVATSHLYSLSITCSVLIWTMGMVPLEETILISSKPHENWALCFVCTCYEWLRTSREKASGCCFNKRSAMRLCCSLGASRTALNLAFECSAGHKVLASIWTVVSNYSLVWGLCEK